MTMTLRSRSFKAGLVVVAGIVFAASSVAPAYASNSSEARALAERAGVHPNQRICVRSEITGTRISRLLCRTQAEWKRSAEFPEIL